MGKVKEQILEQEETAESLRPGGWSEEEMDMYDSTFEEQLNNPCGCNTKHPHSHLVAGYNCFCEKGKV